MVEFAATLQLLREIATEISEKNVTFMAAGIAYNAFLSLAPILVVLLVVVSTVGGGLEARVVSTAQESLPGPIAEIVTTVFEGGAGDPAASIVGVLVLLWGTLKIFRGLDTAFSEIYETTGVGSFVDKLVDGLVVFVALVVAIVATIGVTAAFAAYSNVIPFVGFLTPIILILGLVVAFVPMYYRFPDTDLEWRDVLPGAVFAAIGWAAFQAVFQVYLSFAGGGSDSLFGGVIIVVTWLYFSGLVLLVGAVINAVLGGHTSGKAGGVGAGASTYQTRYEESMGPEAFGRYLDRLQSTLGQQGQVPPDSLYPPPAETITVIEQTKPDGDHEEYSIAFRWRAARRDQ